jgi:hypothetical protein
MTSPAQFVGQCLERLGIAGGQGQFTPGLSQHMSRGPAYALARAGENDNTVVGVHIFDGYYNTIAKKRIVLYSEAEAKGRGRYRQGY